MACRELFCPNYQTSRTSIITQNPSSTCGGSRATSVSVCNTCCRCRNTTRPFVSVSVNIRGVAKFRFPRGPSDSSCTSRHTVFAAWSPDKPSTSDFHSDSDSESESESESNSNPTPEHTDLHAPAEGALSDDEKSSSSSSLSVPPDNREESWLLINGEDVPTVVSDLPITKRYSPRRLLELLTRKLDLQMFSLAQLRSTLMFWRKKTLQEEASFGSYAFEEMKGVSQIHQWTATELTMQHAQLAKIARDVLYLILACSLLGIVRILEALVATFSSRPPHFSKLLECFNSLDFFTVAFLAHSLRKPIIGILRVDPTNLSEVVELKAKIWDEMHKFYERQWKVVATLGVGRLLAVVAQTLPSTNAMTKGVKMCWDMLLALPIF